MSDKPLILFYLLFHYIQPSFELLSKPRPRQDTHMNRTVPKPPGHHSHAWNPERVYVAALPAGPGGRPGVPTPLHPPVPIGSSRSGGDRQRQAPRPSRTTRAPEFPSVPGRGVRVLQHTVLLCGNRPASEWPPTLLFHSGENFLCSH
jgi:hypothetical protein